MHNHTDKLTIKTGRPASRSDTLKNSNVTDPEFIDNRPGTTVLKGLKTMADNYSVSNSPQVIESTAGSQDIAAHPDIVQRVGTVHSDPSDQTANESGPELSELILELEILLNEAASTDVEGKPEIQQVSKAVEELRNLDKGDDKNAKAAAAADISSELHRAGLDPLNMAVPNREETSSSGETNPIQMAAGSVTQRVGTGALVALGLISVGIVPGVILIRRAIRERNARIQAQALEAADAGHSLARHGPNITDAQLITRLTHGIAPDLALSPAPGLSSRFRNHRRWLECRTAAVNELDTALGNSKAAVNPSLTAFSIAWLNAVNAPPANRGPLFAALQGLRNNVQAAVNGIARPNVNHQAPLLYQAPVMGGANAGNIANRVENMVQIRNDYQIVIDHNRPVGVGFSGAGAPAPAPVGHGQIWPATAPAPVFTRSRTTLVPPGGAQPLLIVPAAANWRAAQHFPSTENVGIS